MRDRLRLHGSVNGDQLQELQGIWGSLSSERLNPPATHAGPIPYANLVRDVRGVSGSGGGSYDYSSSPSDDTAVAVSSAAAQEQAASDEEVQAIQQMNDTNALNASMAAAEQQNDAANAATLQTEINAGM